ncbi:phosphoglycerate kinase [Patescibacteria group bacterium]|nr:phosphoglycerate kinase [Patescibacteria group bacterium]
MKFLKDFNFTNKRVLVRVDFNEPIKDGQLASDFKIRAARLTIEYLLEQNAKIILLTHWGRPDGKVVEELKTDLLGQSLSLLIGQKVKKLNGCVGEEIREEIDRMGPGEIILLENVQFEPGEKANNPKFAAALAELADFFILDAFGQAHRDYASISGVPKLLPSCAGLLLAKEVKVLSGILNKPKRPLVVIIGGVKISTKIELIESFSNQADNLLLGGALANTFLKAKGISVGQSVIEEEMVGKVKEMNLDNDKIVSLVDGVVSASVDGKSTSRISPIGDLSENEMILDIGPETVKKFEDIIKKAETIIWNGPMGLFEIGLFASGSNAIAEAITQSKAFSLVGGGDTIALLEGLNLLDKIGHISTGGGAMLEFLAGKKLAGLEALKKQ